MWHGNGDALREVILVGLTDLPVRLEKKGKQIDRERLTGKLRLLSPIVILREATGPFIGDKQTRAGEIFERIYFKNLRKNENR